MTKQTQHRIDHLIEEASALPPGHADRQRLLAEIDALDDDARRMWLEHSRSYESLRSRLGDVVPPDDLFESLMEISRESSRVPLQQSRWATGVPIAAAVLALLVIVSVARVWQSQSDPYRELAMLMVKDHQKQPALTVTSSEPNVIEEELTRAGKMTVRIPSLGDEFNLIGGRLCKFDRAPLAYTRWDHEHLAHSLYQLNQQDFALPDGFDSREIEIAANKGQRPSHRVLIWQEDEFVYGLVCPHPSAVLAPSSPRS